MISGASRRVQELNDSTQIDISECVQATTDRQRRRCQLLKASIFGATVQVVYFPSLRRGSSRQCIRLLLRSWLFDRQEGPTQKPPNSAWLSGKKAFSK